MQFRVFPVMVCLILLTVSSIALASTGEGREFISFGADLNRTERDQMLSYFKPVGQPQMLEVTNSEEYYYVSRYVPKDKIGDRAISSVYLQTLPAGTGIQVHTNRITWVTEGMYANAAVTAGVRDVLIKAVAPYPVSGTAALTGIFKAFEEAQGQPISKARKDAAYQEMITTGKLGEDVGAKNAEGLVRDVKKEVVSKHATNPQEIRIIIENKARQYNLKLSDEQITQLQQLMEKINGLHLNVGEINNQLKSINTRVKGIREQGEKSQGILGQILDLLQRLFNAVVNLFKR